MESTLLSVGSSTMSISLLSKSTPLIAHLHRRLSTTLELRLSLDSTRSGPASLLRGLCPQDPHRNRLNVSARYSASYSSGGGGLGGIHGGSGGGGGDGAADGGDAKPRAVAQGATEPSPLNSEVIILDVTGMTCGGCAASVKRILESQPQVSSASVNLTTETAIVWPASEAKVAPNWQKDVGEALAKHLTSCGFKSNLRDQGAIDEDVQ